MIRRRSGGVARNRHGGAPRGERVMHASPDARRVSPTRLTRAFTGATTITRCALRRSAHPSVRGERRLSGKTRAQKDAPRERVDLRCLTSCDGNDRKRFGAEPRARSPLLCPRPACGERATRFCARRRWVRGLCVAPLTRSNSRTYHCALSPQTGRGHERRQGKASNSAKRVHDRASGTSCKARVVAFPCFAPVPSCYRRPNRAAQATLQARISRFHSAAYGKTAAPGCGRPPVFLLLFTGKYRAAGVALARCRCRSASLPLR